MMRIATVSVTVALGLPLLGCADTDPVAPATSGPRITTSAEVSKRLQIATSDWTPLDPRREALLRVAGVQLTADSDGCVILRTEDGSRVDVVWPAGFTAEQTDQGLVILDPQGGTVVRSGSLLEAGGGTSRATGQPCIADRDVFYVEDELTPLEPT
ncbi:hypothetical protein [Nocardioides kribbensis]|uniref:hypothetical protein n=1 Tax=Nocardioides kribbensis TaxID=305517 RepID=UPI00187952E8|nr:hypothetical protein [Nocardioides kribbensis]